MPWGGFNCFKCWVNYRLPCMLKSLLFKNRKWEIWAKGALLLQNPKWKPGPGASVVKPGVYGCKGESKPFPSHHCNYYYFALRSCQGDYSQALPSCPPAEGFIFLPRVSNLSPLETSLVIWFLPRFISLLPALYFKNVIKAILLLLSWHDFLQPL